MKVVKFGGSSLASAEQMKKCADIIKADPARRFVVPSAPGKRFDGDTKVTDLLYKCYRAVERGESADAIFEKMIHSDILDNCNISIRELRVMRNIYIEENLYYDFLR